MTTENFTNFQEKFKVTDNLIHENKYWALSLRPMHPTLGSSILSLKRAEESFAGLTTDEGASLVKMVDYADKQLKAAFGFDKINYLMLMMVDFHVHFHVIPRYAEAPSFGGALWKDANWPTPPDLGGVALSDDQTREIIEAIKSA